MSNFLSQMVRSSTARAAAVTRTFTPEDLSRPVYPLRLSGFDVIAEIKNRSPSEGELATSTGNLCDRARAYVEGGAAAISVLTEPERFDGHLSHLEEVVAAVAATNTPVMRKDFLVDTVQILEAKAAGASGVLLIGAIFEDADLINMLDCAFGLDLFVLLESFDEPDFERSIHLLQQVKYKKQAARNKFLLGVNSRDLRSLSVEPGRLSRFGPLLPDGIVCVAESGQRDAEDAANAVKWGYSLALVGTALMRADEPAVLIGEMCASGRQAVA